MKIRFIAVGLLISLLSIAANQTSSSRFPYAEAGLTERQAAAHLLNRFTFGPRPGDIDRMVTMGLENWLDEQLTGKLPDDNLHRRFVPFKTLAMTSKEIALTYPNPGLVLLAAQQEGIIKGYDSTAIRENREKILAYAKEKGYRPQRELMAELIGQKLFRAVYSENQLQEVLTDFWFNHFNVSITDNKARPLVLSYERDAIRPHVFGHFREMLGATAKHPAMLAYLDNAQSTAPEGTVTTMVLGVERMKNESGIKGFFNRLFLGNAIERAKRDQEKEMEKLPAELRPRKGINENYARELMELHTLGVDGGYTQKDVVEVARALTGWTIYPYGPRAEKQRTRIEKGKQVGFVVDGDFLFRADAHDATEKAILGEKFPAGVGLEEGERVLDMVASHLSTAKHIARKLAVRFVSDNPPESLVTRLAEIFRKTNGDLRQLIRAIAESPEFWSKSAINSKIKSPLELAVSSLRALDADIKRGRALVQWITRMGQPLYAYQAPTGYPDRGQAWVNSGSLLNRMNFGMNLALFGVQGITFDLSALNNNREPESSDAALRTYTSLLLPERDLTETYRRLQPVIRDPELATKLDKAVPAQLADEPMDDPFGLQIEKRIMSDRSDELRGEKGLLRQTTPGPFAQVVGVILGSPEFQRH